MAPRPLLVDGFVIRNSDGKEETQPVVSISARTPVVDTKCD
jgi:hypothetical protein